MSDASSFSNISEAFFCLSHWCSNTPEVFDFELDVRGETCPYPLIRTKDRVGELQRGEILKVLANDPVAPQNIDAWIKKSGNELLAVEQNNGTYSIFVRKG